MGRTGAVAFTYNPISWAPVKKFYMLEELEVGWGGGERGEGALLNPKP